MSKRTISFSDLPKEVLSKLPFSLRTAGDIHVFDELPSAVQYIIKKYLDSIVPEVTYSDALDVSPEVSIYNDLKVYTKIKDVIIEYLQNYLLISLGSYPFDCDFGSELKHQLQTKDTSLRSTLVGNEIGLIAGVIGGDYDVNVSIVNISISKKEETTHTEYTATLTVSIDDDTFKITV